MNILIGADPEVFVKQNERFLCAHNMIKGDKKNPFKVPHGAVQVDGMALEFNIDPAESEDAFVYNVTDVYRQLRAMVPGYNVVPEPVAIFDQEYFNDCDPEAKILGCDPDYNGWTGVANDPPTPTLPMRSAAGHIHVGWTDGADPFEPDHFQDCCMVARQLDYMVGIQTLLWDPDNRRRSLYGKAGAFRPKPYGMEYRVPSNAWLRNEALMRYVYQATKKGVELLFDGVSLPDKYGDAAKQIIDNNVIDWPTNYKFEEFQPYQEAA